VKLSFSELLPECFDGVELVEAGLEPGGPEIEKDDFPVQFAQIQADAGVGSLQIFTKK
jgi:hypothetical protein